MYEPRRSMNILYAALVAALTTASCGGVPAGPTASVSEALRIFPFIPEPPGYNHYCSMVDPSGAWGFATGPDACQGMLSDWGWSPANIKKAGMYDQNGYNTVILECEIGPWHAQWYGWGDEPLATAFQQASTTAAGLGCQFTVAPVKLPVFNAPFSLYPLPYGFQFSNRAYDFAMIMGNVYDRSVTMDVSQFGQPLHTFGGATSVSYRGQDRTGSPDDQHDAFDWSMNASNPLRALADGQVITRRSRAVPGCFTATQNELFIKHIVGTNLRYAETFITYYAHLNFQPGLEVGMSVTAGQVIGYVSNSGCTGGANHLHLAVIRQSNTARDYHPDFDATPGMWGPYRENPDNSVARIDPYGMISPAGIDPGGYFFFDTTVRGMGPTGTGSDRVGAGALSIILWKDGQAPPRPCDEDAQPHWFIGSFLYPYANSQAHCP